MRVIAHVTDVHLDEESLDGPHVDRDGNWSRVLKHLADEPVDEVVFGGDIGAPSSHERFFAALAGLNVPLRLVPGNHDVVADVSKHYSRSACSDELYEFEPASNGWSRLYLDSSLGRIGVGQLAWLRERLSACGPVIIFVHHPVFPIETPIDRLYPLEARKEVQRPLLAHAHPVVLFCGHYHLEDETGFENVSQITTPAVSMQVVKGSEDLRFDTRSFGYRRIKISDGSVESEVVWFEARD